MKTTGDLLEEKYSAEYLSVWNRKSGDATLCYLNLFFYLVCFVVINYSVRRTLSDFLTQEMPR